MKIENVVINDSGIYLRIPFSEEWPRFSAFYKTLADDIISYVKSGNLPPAVRYFGDVRCTLTDTILRADVTLRIKVRGRRVAEKKFSDFWRDDVIVRK